MLTDLKLRHAKPREKTYKIADRDGLYAAVLTSGAVSFRWNYRINGRQETLTIGRYGEIGLSEARELLIEAKKRLAAGMSPARHKAREARRDASVGTFGEWAKQWLTRHAMAESTRDMRRSIYVRDLEPRFGRLKMTEITSDDLRALCDEIVARGAPSSAVAAREVVQWVYGYANDRGNRFENPAASVKPTSIATFVPRSRALALEEIGLLYGLMERVATSPIYRLAVKFLLLTMVRKGELAGAEWSEIRFSDAVWEIPGERMKRRNPHVVYLSRQALDILVTLKTCAGGSRYVIPGRYDPDQRMSAATLNRVTSSAIELAQQDGIALRPFVLHDFRRTASTILHEAGYNTDWIEKCLAHEQKGVRAVYNRAEYAEQRRAMLQDWADMIDRWTGVTRPASGVLRAVA